METVKSYIEEQRTDEHKRKYIRKSEYWVGKGKSRSVKTKLRLLPCRRTEPIRRRLY